MSKQKKDQTLDSPSQTVSSNDDFFFPMNKKMKLDELQREAYFNVLRAFNAESSQVSTPRTTITEEIKKELNIANETHKAFEDKLKANPWREEDPMDCDDDWKITAVGGSPLRLRMKVNKEDLLKFQEKLNVSPAKMQQEKAKPSSTTSDDSPIIPGWGQATPASLVNRWVYIKPPREEGYVPYLIRDYDAKTEMHYLVPSLSRKDLVDPCNWIDLRHIPVETVWPERHPGYPTRTCILKPGETILHETSTAREKRHIQEIGKTASGIPILQRILDKGKGKAIA